MCMDVSLTRRAMGGRVEIEKRKGARLTEPADYSPERVLGRRTRCVECVECSKNVVHAEGRPSTQESSSASHSVDCRLLEAK